MDRPHLLAGTELGTGNAMVEQCWSRRACRMWSSAEKVLMLMEALLQGCCQMHWQHQGEHMLVNQTVCYSAYRVEKGSVFTPCFLRQNKGWWFLLSPTNFRFSQREPSQSREPSPAARAHVDPSTNMCMCWAFPTATDRKEGGVKLPVLDWCPQSVGSP